MTLALNLEQSEVVERAIRAGVIRDAGDVIEVGVDAIRRRLESASGRANEMSHEEWSKALHEFVNRDRPEAPLLSEEDISRESIYSDRGL